MLKNNALKKIFSTANLFFICIFNTFIFEYFYSTFEETILANPNSAKIALSLAIVAFPICFYFKFPLFVEVEIEHEELSNSENIYSKNINFWSKIYIGIFYWTRISRTVSLFGKERLRFEHSGKNSKFTLISNIPRTIHRFFDIVLTLVCSAIVFLISKEFAKYGVFFGFLFTILTILIIYKKVIFNYVYSVNIGNHEGYRLNVMFPHSHFDGVFSTVYGLAYDKYRTILLHKDVFSGSNKLKRYILTHEEGHLKTRNPKQSSLLTFVFIFTSFLGISGPTVVSKIWPNMNRFVWIIVLLYFLFLYVFDFAIKSKNKADELKADSYAIKKIGKNAVLDALNIIKSDNSYNHMVFNLSGISIDRRLDFVREYQNK